MLNELLTTHRFVDNVAHRSPLADYLSRNPSSGWGPGALMSKLTGAKPLDDRIAVALGPKRVLAVVKGPHVLELSFDAQTPTVASQTLSELLAQFKKERTALRTDALTGYRNMVVSASDALTKAQTTIGSYLREHPNATSKDPQFRALVHSEQSAIHELGSATQVFNQQSDTLVSAGSGQPTLVVLDSPKPPTAPLAGKRHLVMGIVAGLFAGCLISILGIVVLTKVKGPAAPEGLRPVTTTVVAPLHENGSIAAETVRERGTLPG